MSDELDDIQADVTNGQSTQIERDEAFCARMREAIAAGLPGTKNPKYVPTDKTPVVGAPVRRKLSKAELREQAEAAFRVWWESQKAKDK